MIYDYLIVGAGLYGSVCAYELTRRSYTVCVIDSRNHIGGNCYTSNRNGIHVHEYGPHIFHTSNSEIWEFVNKFSKFNNFIYSPVANYRGEIFSLPFNMWTFSKMWPISTPSEAMEIIKSQSNGTHTPSNLKEMAIKLVGVEIFEKLIEGYTEKQWGRSCSLLPPEIIKRLPVRFTYNNNYFNDKYQGIPMGGYTKMFERMLSNSTVKLNTNFFNDSLPQYKKLIYTGPIDAFFGYKYGELEYRSLRWEHKRYSTDNFQGVSVMNYTDIETPYTRTIEHKFFEEVNTSDTWVSFEYPTKHEKEINYPCYPINDEKNNEIYKLYKSESEKLNNVYFGGRLADYKYYDMHQVIGSALKRSKTYLGY